MIPSPSGYAVKVLSIQWVGRFFFVIFSSMGFEVLFIGPGEVGTALMSLSEFGSSLIDSIRDGRKVSLEIIFGILLIPGSVLVGGSRSTGL
tara:strand:+ start:236 stop:508 length:273 start_codon:yes stop_codon:yes gene_type:complete